MTKKKNVSKILVEKYRQFSNFCNYILSLTKDYKNPDGLRVGSWRNDVKTDGGDWLHDVKVWTKFRRLMTATQNLIL
jgi:hypothetical protein